MRMTVKMPRAADTVDEVVVSEWIAAGRRPWWLGRPDPRVETDKALVEVPAPVAGTVVEQLVVVDDEITTGTPIAVIESS